MGSSHSTNGNTFRRNGWYRRRETRTTTCPAASDYSSLSLHRDPGSKFDPCSDLALRKLKPTDREYLSTVSTNMSPPSLMAFLLLRRGSIFSIFFQDSRLKSFSGQTWIFLQEKRNDSSLFFLNIWKREMRLVVNRADWILILDVGTSSKSSLRISRVIKIIFRYFYIGG